MKNFILTSVLITNFLFANEKTVNLQLNWLHQFQFAGYYMAKEKGFYKDLGLDVNIKEFTYNLKIIEEIENSNSDFAIGRSSLLVEKANGANIVALGAIFQESPLMLLVKKDSNINEIKDLKNKKIMFTNETALSASILAMLNANKLRSNDYQMVEHSFKLDDLISNKVDAMASYLSNEPIILKDRNIEFNIFYPKDYGFDFYSDILFTSSKFIKENPKVTKDFYDASIKGWLYAFDNLAETAEIIHSKYNTQNKSIIHLIKEGEILKKLAHLDKEGIGDLNETKLNNIVNIFRIFGLANNDINIDEFIYDENPYKTMNIEISEQEKKYLIFIFLFIFIILSLAIYLFFKNKQTKELLSTVINTSNDLIFYKNNRFKYIGCNKSFENLLGKKQSEIIGRTDFEIFDKEFAEIFRKYDLLVLETNNISINEEYIQSTKDKKLFQMKRIPFEYKKNKQGILGIGSDITQLHEVQEKLKKQAYCDELTNTYNRKAYNERIQEKLDLFDRYQTDFCIAMYDIDDFKFINDTYGHDIGDKVLKEISSEVRMIIRKTDLFFRVGGEEFVIIFPETPIDEAYKIAEKIRIDISNMNIIKTKVTISIGITQSKIGDNNKSIYSKIDKLMYKSKHNGKNQTSRD
jgi:diguanylate cyclase (GGDEF)-like protein/PAS domain S-box-containing protein